jgi:amidohydrolase
MVRRGATTAGFDTFDFELRGKGGHGAFPADGGDPVAAAAALVSQLQSIVTRHVAATESIVLAVTEIHGGSAYNVIPELVTVRGSVRWFNRAVRDAVMRRMGMHADGIAQAFGLAVALEYRETYPAVINADDAARLAIAAATDVAGEQGVVTDLAPFPGSDDFAFLSNTIPGAYLAIGNGSGEGSCVLHSPHYDFNEESIVPGALFWAALCYRFFAENIDQPPEGDRCHVSAVASH